MEAMRVWVGYDERERNAFSVACHSILLRASRPVVISPVGMDVPSNRDLYWRPTGRRGNQLWDVISEAPMSTGFAIARFLVPHLAGFKGWAVFCDCDFLFRTDIAELFDLADPSYAVQVVKHHYVTGFGASKMDGQQQTSYPRKNWSSLVLWNCGHPANRVLTPTAVNSLTGRDLHALSWLNDEQVGGLPFEWNWLELEPLAVHFTRGTPDMPGYENSAYAEEWRAHLQYVQEIEDGKAEQQGQVRIWRQIRCS